MLEKTIRDLIDGLRRLLDEETIGRESRRDCHNRIDNANMVLNDLGIPEHRPGGKP